MDKQDRYALIFILAIIVGWIALAIPSIFQWNRNELQGYLGGVVGSLIGLLALLAAAALNAEYERQKRDRESLRRLKSVLKLMRYEVVSRLQKLQVNLEMWNDNQSDKQDKNLALSRLLAQRCIMPSQSMKSEQTLELLGASAEPLTVDTLVLYSSNLDLLADGAKELEENFPSEDDFDLDEITKVHMFAHTLAEADLLVKQIKVSIEFCEAVILQIDREIAR